MSPTFQPTKKQQVRNSYQIENIRSPVAFTKDNAEFPPAEPMNVDSVTQRNVRRRSQDLPLPQPEPQDQQLQHQNQVDQQQQQLAQQQQQWQLQQQQQQQQHAAQQSQNEMMAMFQKMLDAKLDPLQQHVDRLTSNVEVIQSAATEMDLGNYEAFVQPESGDEDESGTATRFGPYGAGKGKGKKK